jgi:CBS domain-containing protein
MNVREIMTSGVERIDPNTTLKEAARRMKSMDIGFLPVCEKDRLVGTVTDRDIAVRSVAEGHDVSKTTVDTIMSRNAFFCYDDEDVEECGRQMQGKSVRRMLVLSRDKKLIGVVSLGDIARISGVEPLAARTLKQVSRAA